MNTIQDLLFILTYLMFVFGFGFLLSVLVVAVTSNFLEITTIELGLIIATIYLVYSVFEFSRLYKQRWTPAIIFISVLLFISELVKTNKSGQNKVEYDIEPTFQSLKFKNVISNMYKVRIH